MRRSNMHALERAKERYGLDLTKEDLRDISKRCVKLNNVVKMGVKDAYGHFRKMRGAEGPYKLEYNGTLICVVLVKSGNKADKRYYVGTFIPLPEDKNVNYISSKLYRELTKERD